MALTVYSVKQFNELVNTVLNEQVGEVTVTGEVSGYQVRQNKWISFDLKDQDSILNCFTTPFQLDFPIADGQEILVTGTPRIYVPYGKYSFNVRTVQLKGEGALKKAFEELKNKLEVEGLFDTIHKRPLPRFPQTIGIITSADGAAINDIIKVTNRRWGGLSLFLAPVLVQGANAPDELVSALQYFNQHHPVDVIIFGRGGGSLEDLQAFNSERVARAIFSSRIPVISGIGHEHNTSIADLVADVRAATPSNAAEIAVPDRETVRRELLYVKHRCHQGMTQKLTRANQSVGQTMQTLQLFMSGRMGEIRLLILSLYQKFAERKQRVSTLTSDAERLTDQLKEQMKCELDRSKQRWHENIKLLSALNPSAILKRGYSITYQVFSGKPIVCLADLPSDGKIRTQISDGSFEATVANHQVSKVSKNLEITPLSTVERQKKSSVFHHTEQSKLF